MRHFLKTPHCIHPHSLSEGVRGFGAPGKLSSGQFSAENGRQPRTTGKPPYNNFFLMTSGSINARSAGGTSNSVLHLKNTQTDSPIAIFKQVISTDYIDNISCMFIISQTVRCDHRQMNCLVCFSLCLENTDFV